MQRIYALYFLLVVFYFWIQFPSIHSTSQQKVHSRLARAAIHPNAQRWPNNEVYYTFSEWNSPRKFADRKKIRKAMSIWSNATCIQFKELSASALKTNNQLHYLIIKNERNCSSEVTGMGSVRPGQNNQILYLSTDHDCLHRGVILHELGHVLGLIHEHQRPNRDIHITINRENIKPIDGPPHFAKFSEGHILNSIYDRRSVMHYNNNFMAKESSLKTIITNDRSLIGDLNWKDITFHDAKVVMNQYQCASHCEWSEACSTDESFLDKNCRCVTISSFRKDRCIDEWPSEKCLTWKNQGICQQRVNDMYVFCQRTCQMCNIYPDEINAKALRAQKSEPPTCKDNNQYCSYWARTNQCRLNPRYMNKECQKSCNKCKKPRAAKQTTISPEEAEVIMWPADECHDSDDSKDICDTWKTAGFCQTRQSAMSRRCPFTCGFCEAPVSRPRTTTSPLVHESCTREKTSAQVQLCEVRVIGDFCQTSRDFMLRNGCARECGWCPQQTVEESVAATTSPIECQDHIFWMEKKKGSDAAESPAVETRNKCVIWAARSLCSKSIIQRLCPKSCGLCSKTLTTKSENVLTTKLPVAPEGMPCGNTGSDDFCAIYHSLGHCDNESRIATMMNKCARTCGFRCRD